MKLNVKEFSQIIREIVRDEVKKALPGMVKEALAEQYLRRMMAEQSGYRESPPARPVKRTLENTFIAPDEPEHIPEPMENNDEGVYQEDPLLKKANEVKQALLAKNPGMAVIFEGTKPLQAAEAGPAPGEVSEKAMAKLGVLDPNKMRALVTGKKQEVAVDEARLAQLAEQRRRLEVPVGGAPRQAAPAQQRQKMPNPFFDPGDFAPIVLEPDQQ